MLKKILIIIGSLSILILLMYGGYLGWFKYQESKYAPHAVPYLERITSELAKWDAEHTKKLLHPAAISAKTDEDLIRLNNWLKKLGALRATEKPTLVHITSKNTSAGTSKILTYNIKADCDRGDAVVVVGLLVLDSDFKIYSFYVHTTAFWDSPHLVDGKVIEPPERDWHEH